MTSFQKNYVIIDIKVSVTFFSITIVGNDLSNDSFIHYVMV